MKIIDYDAGADHTLYALKAVMNQDHQEVAIGKLGIFSFRKGIYVYVGSAKRNIEARIARHLKLEKKLHWHFDYLRPFLKIVEVQTFPGEVAECQLFQRLMKEQNGTIPALGFGSSDCRCQAHLFYCEK